VSRERDRERGEREREPIERKEHREERSKEKMIDRQQEDAEKRGTMPILPLAVAFGIVASACAFSRQGIGCGATKRERESEFIATFPVE